MLPEGHKSYYTTIRGPDILCNEILSHMLHPAKSINFRKYNILCIIDETPSWTGFCQRTLVWRPLL